MQADPCCCCVCRPPARDERGCQRVYTPVKVLVRVSGLGIGSDFFLVVSNRFECRTDLAGTRSVLVSEMDDNAEIISLCAAFAVLLFAVFTVPGRLETKMDTVFAGLTGLFAYALPPVLFLLVAPSSFRGSTAWRTGSVANLGLSFPLYSRTIWTPAVFSVTASPDCPDTALVYSADAADTTLPSGAVAVRSDDTQVDEAARVMAAGIFVMGLGSALLLL